MRRHSRVEQNQFSRRFIGVVAPHSHSTERRWLHIVISSGVTRFFLPHVFCAPSHGGRNLPSFPAALRHDSAASCSTTKERKNGPPVFARDDRYTERLQRLTRAIIVCG